MNTEASTPESTGLSTQEAAASIAKQLFPETDNQQTSDDTAVKAKAQETEEVEGDESQEGEEETESEEVEATDEEDVESEGEEEAEAEEEDEDAPRYTVKVDGKDVEVPLPELLAGYSRQSDYTRKTQALAKEREEFQPQVESVRQERAQYAHLLGILEQQVKAGAPENIDWVKRYDEDPIAAQREHLVWQENQARLTAIKSEQERIEQHQKAEREQQHLDLLRKEAEKVVEKIPTWADPKKAQLEQAAIKNYAVSKLGFSPDELKTIGDHRVILTLRKAWQFDQLTERSKTTKPVVPKAKTATPGSAQTPRKGTEVARATQRLAKTGSVLDAAAVIRQKLG